MRTYDNAWTDADKARLVEIIAAGGTATQASHLLERSRPAILQMAHKLECRWLRRTHMAIGTYARAELEWPAVRMGITKGDAAWPATARFEDAVVASERGTVSRPDVQSLTGNAAEMCAR